MENNLICVQFTIKTENGLYFRTPNKSTNNNQFITKLSNDFYRLVNEIVNVGGIILVDKSKLDLEEFNDGAIVQKIFTAKVPENKIDEIRKLSMVESYKII